MGSGQASFHSHVAPSDKARIQALYAQNHARAHAGWAARLDEWLQRRQRRLIGAAAGFAPQQRVLDVGAGQGCMVRVAKQAGAHVTAVDLVPELVQALGHLADRAVQGDLESLQEEARYDRVLAIGVLDFVVAPSLALQRLATWTAPGGRLLILVPTLSPGGLFYRFEKWCRGVRVNIYRPRWLKAELQTHGLRCMGMRRPLPSNVLLTFVRPNEPQSIAQ